MSTKLRSILQSGGIEVKDYVKAENQKHWNSAFVENRLPTISHNSDWLLCYNTLRIAHFWYTDVIYYFNFSFIMSNEPRWTSGKAFHVMMKFNKKFKIKTVKTERSGWSSFFFNFFL